MKNSFHGIVEKFNVKNDLFNNLTNRYKKNPLSTPLQELEFKKRIKRFYYNGFKYPLIEIISDKTEINVAPRQYVVENFSDNFDNRIIGTYCANPCHIITIYSPYEKKGCIAHIDHLCINFEHSLNEILSNFDSKENLRCNLFGGNNLPDSRRVNKEVTNAFKVHNLSFDDESNNGEVRSIGLDLKNGNIYELVASHIDRQENDKDFQLKIRGSLNKKESSGLERKKSRNFQYVS